MSQMNGFLLMMLLVANPVILLVFQNCSVMPQAKDSKPESKPEINSVKKQTKPAQKIVRYNFEKSMLTY